MYAQNWRLRPANAHVKVHNKVTTGAAYTLNFSRFTPPVYKNIISGSNITAKTQV